MLWVKLKLSEMFATVLSLMRFVGKLMITQSFLINQGTEFYSNNTTNLRPLTPHVMSCYTHKMVIVSWP